MNRVKYSDRKELNSLLQILLLLKSLVKELLDRLDYANGIKMEIL